MPRLKKPAGGARIAIIDDDPELLLSTRRLLADEGHTVQAVATASAGIELVREFKPQLVLLDYYLGSGIGADVVRSIRRFDDMVQVLLVTGYAAEQPARKLLEELDIQGYHDKADGPERLLVWVAASLKHARLLERMNRQQGYLRRILDATPRISTLQAATSLLDVALRSLSEILQGGDGLIATENNGLFVLDDATRGVSLHAGTGQFAGVDEFSRLAPELVAIVREGFDLERPTLHARGYVLVPLRTRTGARGCMAVETPSFPDEAIDPAEIFGRQVVQALENIVLYERATVDPLTRLFHRSFGMQRLTETLRLATRLATPTSVLMIDVDHFKRLNDTHGHAAGDLALRMIARVIAGACRSTDIVARFGGEEMFVVLPATPRDGAITLATHVAECVANTRIEFEGSQLACTVSIGVSTQPPTGPELAIDADALVRRADLAMYRAKTTGRNRVCEAARDPITTDHELNEGAPCPTHSTVRSIH
ncbi:diguanylate cyclase [Nannocystaceae bacterium ST9]